MMQNPVSDPKSKKTIRGMVVPSKWDDRFQITGILVACRDEREVRVENLETFPILRTLAQQEALFTGVIRNVDGAESILLESFTLINGARE